MSICNNQSLNENLLKEAKENLLYITERPSIVMEKGKGMYLWDTEGKSYLDFIGGWAVTALGHCPEVIIEALERQGKELINPSPAFYNKPMIEFARLLTSNSCFDKVFFTSTGAEANESAIKLARKYGSKFLKGAYEIITTVNGFHGRTLATMSATGKAHWKEIYEPKVSGFKHVPLNDIEALHEAITESTCAIMLEPIQGEGGVNEASAEYILELRKVCDSKDILLIFDEVQTGLGRTGKLFAYEHYGIEPDIMTLAKGIGGGYPLSAMLTKDKYNIFEAGDQGGTYCGNPLGMAVGMAVVEEIIKKDLTSNAQVQGEYILKKLNEIQTKFLIKNIRGKGLLIAFDLPMEKGKEVVDKCLKAGVLINSPKPSTIRLIPPLIVTKEDIDNMFDILEKVLEEI
ncbi:MAG: acetylornithine/succinylornithine family transaminase [Bacillota bacterium]|nr:acetylornithine/succinylornithine family transaminase [Bacillota bacterium]